MGCMPFTTVARLLLLYVYMLHAEIRRRIQVP